VSVSFAGVVLGFFVGDLPYRFLPEISPSGGQIGLNGGKLRKTLHLLDTIGGGKRIQENPPPGTKINCFRLNDLQFLLLTWFSGYSMLQTAHCSKTVVEAREQIARVASVKHFRVDNQARYVT
jgi:hypothetical protein